jgi:hypothetical protein
MPEMLLEPVRDQSAWKSADYENSESWIYRLSEQEVAEIEAALKGIQARGLSVPDFGRDEFPLPTLAEKIGRAIEDVEDGRGFALLRGLPVEKYDLDTLRMIYWGIGAYFGDPISQNSKGQILADVVDLGNDYGDINSRGYKTNATLLPHVDSSDTVALLCVNTGRSGGESMLSSSISIYNEILEHHRDYLPVLCRGFHRDLRGEGVTEKIDEVTFHEIPIFSYFGNQLSCDFNERIIRSARVRMNQPLTDIEEAALNCVMTLARRPDIQFRMHLQQGDIQLVNNYTVLHSRAAYTDHADPERKRRLMRFWVNSRNARALDPSFANKYNTGPRGGVAVGDGARYDF